MFRRGPLVAQAIIRSLLVRLSSTKRFHSLAEDLIRSPTDLAKCGALLVSEVVNQRPDLREQITTHKLAIISESIFPVRKREQAGRVLSRLEYPLDCAALAEIPAGIFIFGSRIYPNSQPQGELPLGSCRIGVYPVVNPDYVVFISKTGRNWLSIYHNNEGRLNAPATDVTWHDARANCEWLTQRWRASKKIS